MTAPKTLAEKLDAAQTGDEFAAVLLGFMAAYDEAEEEQ